MARLRFEIIHCKGMPGTIGSHQRDQLAGTVLKLLVLGAFDFGKVVYSGKTGKNTKRTLACLKLATSKLKMTTKQCHKISFPSVSQVPGYWYFWCLFI